MATLSDIAKIVGVSTSTVSRVLNEQPGIAIPTEKKSLIFQTAEALNYRVKVGKRTVGKNLVRRLGVIGWYNEEWALNIPYYSLIRHGIEKECRALGFDGSAYQFQWSDAIRSYSIFQDFDGIIVIGHNKEAADYFRDKNQRVIYVDSSPDPHRYDSIVPDFIDGVQQALTHLIAQGYTSIGYLGGENESAGTLPRYSTFKSFMEERGLFRPEFVHLEGDWTVTTGYAMAQVCTEQKTVARAYLVANDPMAIGAMHAFAKAGLKVPQDVAIIGFDDIEMSAFVRPPLSTVRIPAENCGRLAVHLLVDGLSDHTLPLRITVPTEMIVRESS